MLDSSTFKRFSASIENILENLEDLDFTAFGNISEIFKIIPPIRNTKNTKTASRYFQTSFFLTELPTILARICCVHIYSIYLE